MQRTYRGEFPEWVEEWGMELDGMLPAHWRDTSWHNDVCPSWRSDAGGVRVWIDYLVESSRENGPESPVFAVQVEDVEGEAQDAPALYEGDHWETVLLVVALREAEASLRRAADAIGMGGSMPALRGAHAAADLLDWSVWCGELYGEK